MRKALILVLASVILSGCGGDKQDAEEVLSRQLGESRNVKVHEVFDGRSPWGPAYTYLCGLVTYDQDNGAPIRGQTPFVIEEHNGGGTSSWIAPYSERGSGFDQQYIITNACGIYDRQSGRWTPSS